MFTSFRIQNFRTHRDTFFKLKDLTLFMGGNGSGKTNLLEGLNFFSRKISTAYEQNNTRALVNRGDYLHNKHTLDRENKPIIFTAEGAINENTLDYTLTLYWNNENVFCTEKLLFNQKEYSHGENTHSHELLLRKKIQTEIEGDALRIANNFFRSLSFLYYFNLQPSFLKGKAVSLDYEGKPVQKRDFLSEERKPNLASALGSEGANFLSLLIYVQKTEQETFNRFVGFLKRFEPSFVGINYDERKGVQWQFDMETDFPYFTSDKVSDGFIKAAAVALLCAMKNPPALIMLEEVENGINQRNIEEFIGWLISASRVGRKPQFIVTSHSPSVLRLFADRLDCVYNVHLRKKKGFISEIGNLNEAIVQLVKFGAFNENDIKREVDGVVHLAPVTVAELFYSGVIGSM